MAVLTRRSSSTIASNHGSTYYLLWQAELEVQVQAAFAAQEALAEAQGAAARSGAGDAMRCLDLEREMKALRMQLDAH